MFIHGWGGTVRSVVPVFAKALAERAGSAERTPYVIAPMFPRHETMAKQNEPEDGRSVWGDSWSNESRHPNQMGLAWGGCNGTGFR